MATVTFGGSEWPLSFDMQALWQVEQRFQPGSDGMDGIQQAMQELAAGRVGALAAFVWAGMQLADKSLTYDDVLSLLDEASPAELVALPMQITDCLSQFMAVRKSGGGGGKPWRWSTAKAAWVTEWGQPLDSFWRTTLAEFGDLSDGRAALYAKPEDEEEPVDVDPLELIRSQKRR